MLNKEQISFLAKEYGFDLCYFSPPICKPEWEEHLKQYDFCDMDYMKNNLELRADPKKIWPEVETIITLGLNYYHPKQTNLFSAYAYGDDYHDFFKKKLKKFAKSLGVDARVYCDTAPVMEKQLAISSGLGWQGKNTLIISPKIGSFFFLGEVFINQKIEDLDEPTEQENLCKNCNLCQKACPTGALDEDYKLNVKKCISYLTIEHKGEIIKDCHGKIYGCDECLYACPHNQKAPISNLKIREFIHEPIDYFAQLNENDFRRIFSKSPIKRIGYQRFIRNINLKGFSFT